MNCAQCYEMYRANVWLPDAKKLYNEIFMKNRSEKDVFYSYNDKRIQFWISEYENEPIDDVLIYRQELNETTENKYKKKLTGKKRKRTV